MKKLALIGAILLLVVGSALFADQVTTDYGSNMPNDGFPVPANARSGPQPTARQIQLNQGFSDSLGSRNDRNINGYYVDYFFYTGRTNERIIIGVTADAFDAVIRVTTTAGYSEVCDDFFGLNPAISYTFASNDRLGIEVTSLSPATGAYIVTASNVYTDYDNNTNGYGDGYGDGYDGSNAEDWSQYNYGADVYRDYPQNTQLRSGTMINSRLTATDRAGTRGYEDSYTFQAQAGQRVTVDLTSPDFDCYLMVNGPGGYSGYNDDADSTHHSLLEFTAPAAGVYTILVTSFGSGITGSYNLIATAGVVTPTTPSATSTQPISPGVSVNGQLASGDAQGSRGYEDRYTFSAQNGQNIVVNVRFTNFDGYLVLTSPSGRSEENDDYTNTRDSQISTRATETGTYTIVVTSFQRGLTGAYTLSLSLASAVSTSPSSPVPVGISAGMAVQGTLGPTDYIGLRGYEDHYTIPLQVGQQISVVASYNNFDGYLTLRSPSSAVWTNDDYPDTRGSMISVAADMTGTYTIIVTSFAAGSALPAGSTPSVTGSYTLFTTVTSTATTPSATSTQPISPGVSVNGQLASGDAQGSRGYEDRYTFSAQNGQNIVVNVRFTNFDGYLVLTSPSGRSEENDDYTNTRDSQISTRATETGTYTIVVTSFQRGLTGAYTLSLSLASAVATTPSVPIPVGISAGMAVQGALGPTDYIGTRGYEDYFTLPLQVGQQISIVASYNNFDGYLTLRSPSSAVWTNDDYPDTRGSMISVPADMTGTYTIIVTSYAAGSGMAGATPAITGSYTLFTTVTSVATTTPTVTPTVTPTQTATVVLQNNVPVGGALARTDPISTLQRGSYEDRYVFNADRGNSIVVDVSFAGYDGYLYLLSPSGQVWSNDDAPGQGTTRSRIEQMADASGTYTVVVSSFSSGVTGNYTVTLSLSTVGASITPVQPNITPIQPNITPVQPNITPVQPNITPVQPNVITPVQPATAGGTITSGVPVNGSLQQGDAVGTLRRGSYEDRYSFTAQAGQAIVADVTFQGFDGYIFLISPSGQQWYNDDAAGAGSTARSRIEASADATGTYTFIVTSFSARATGTYTATMTLGGRAAR